jgi:hypothetical protein
MEIEQASDDYDRGGQDARQDIAGGFPKLYWPTRGSWGELLAQAMAERFGVRVEHIGDMRTESQSAYWRGYNDMVTAHIAERFGAGTFQAVMSEVERFRLERTRRHLESS